MVHGFFNDTLPEADCLTSSLTIERKISADNVDFTC